LGTQDEDKQSKIPTTIYAGYHHTIILITQWPSSRKSWLCLPPIKVYLNYVDQLISVLYSKRTDLRIYTCIQAI
jgi:hypothetical protein